MLKDRLLISFSGGQTSGYMAKMIKENWSDKYEIICVFANTGLEREETLEFVKKCDKKFNLNVVWVEAVVHYNKRKGCTHKVVDFKSAARNGEPFTAVIKKYGIPNVQFLHCTRELKANPIKSYAKSIGWEGWYTAIGIRIDEVDRVSANHKKFKYIYPLAFDWPTRKIDINEFWQDKNWSLKLKSYEGNCDYCFKKTLRKLMTIYQEDTKNRIQWWLNTEKEFENFAGGRDGISPPYRFNRKGMTVQELIDKSNEPFMWAVDESWFTKQLAIDQDLDVSNGCEESCEPFK